MSIMDLIEKGKRSVSKKHGKKASKDTVIGVAVGLTVGAVASVLLTPKSGKEIREDLTNTAKELPEKTKEVLEMVKGKVEEAKEKLGGNRE